jgi:hypothetical protein
VASTYGQASYNFDTYSASVTGTTQGQVSWSSLAGQAPGGRGGTLVTAADSFNSDLLWAVGATTGDLGLSIPVSSKVLGYIEDPTSVTFDPAYAGGPITFTINVWQGGSYAAASAAGSGLGYGSVTFVDSGTVPAGPPISFNSDPAFTVQLSTIVPEPTTLALAGLGAAGMLLFRKRQ